MAHAVKAPALQVQRPEFKLQFHKKTKKKAENNNYFSWHQFSIEVLGALSPFLTPAHEAEVKLKVMRLG
jgi:hypothetical protein